MHVGLVLPGFVATEGFPQQELRDRAATRWMVSTPDKVAEAIVDAGLERKPERYVPRPYAFLAGLRVLAPEARARRMTGADNMVTPCDEGLARDAPVSLKLRSSQ